MQIYRITRGYSEYEYPLRHFIMNKYKNIEIEIIYTYVRNLSRKLDNINYKKLCAVVVFKCDETDINCTSMKKLNLPNKLKKISFENKVILYN